jgi:hypothetical protein
MALHLSPAESKIKMIYVRKCQIEYLFLQYHYFLHSFRPVHRLVVYVENVRRLLRRIYSIVCSNLVVLSCLRKIRHIEGDAKCRHLKK